VHATRATRRSIERRLVGDTQKYLGRIVARFTQQLSDARVSCIARAPAAEPCSLGQGGREIVQPVGRGRHPTARNKAARTASVTELDIASA